MDRFTDRNLSKIPQHTLSSFGATILSHNARIFENKESEKDKRL
jgi:hypothetical protein